MTATPEQRGPGSTLRTEELARAAGVEQADVDALVASGVVAPDAEGLFKPSDISRVRLLMALTESGLGLDAMAVARAAGKLSFDYVDYLMPHPVACIPGPTGEAADELWRYVVLLEPILGGRLGSTDIRADELALAHILKRAVELGAPTERVVGILRAMARSARHLVDLQRDFLDEVLLDPAVANAGSVIEALESTAPVRMEFRDLGRRLASLLMEHFVDEAVFENVVRLTELAVGESGVAAPTDGQAVVFLDVSSYTKKSQEAGDAAAARQAVLLADFVHRHSSRHGGRMVKSLGDGAMAHFPNATAAVNFAVESINDAPRSELWNLHAGVNTGSMLRRDGDYYGTTVNVASRVADRAAMDQVMVTRAVVDAWNGGDSVTFTLVGDVALKNVADPVELYFATA
jgi:adenylate cyclase